MKADKIRNLTDVELSHQERDIADQLFKLKFQMNMGQNESLKKMRGLRKDIARVKTILESAIARLLRRRNNGGNDTEGAGPPQRSGGRGCLEQDAQDHCCAGDAEESASVLRGAVIARHKKFYAHDESNQAHVGDVVRIEETRPLSKLKRWKLKDVVRKAALLPEAAAEAAS